ncbi:MAG: SNF2-related protein [Pseudomonadota bacterium]
MTRPAQIGFGAIHGLYHSLRLADADMEAAAVARASDSGKIDLYPHQIDAAVFALNSVARKGVILADEVGLGKTIEAGLVMAQFWATGKRRILLIVPASIQVQWQGEMAELFELPVQILDRQSAAKRRAAGEDNVFDQDGRILAASYEFAARNAKLIEKVEWDLVVLDEAHRLRNVYKPGKGALRAKALRAALKDRFKVLLTATPIHNDIFDLFGLVSIIDPSYFGSLEAFRSLYNFDSPERRWTLRKRVQPLFKRHLRAQVQETGAINFTRRQVKTFDFEPNADEAELYELVTDFLLRLERYSYGGEARNLLLTVFRKILGSSTHALGKTLEKLFDRLRRQLPIAKALVRDIESPIDLSGELALSGLSQTDRDLLLGLQEEMEAIQQMVTMAGSITSNAKGDRLVSALPNILDEVSANGAARKAVIFTESVNTQKYLFDLLESNGYSDQILSLNGSNQDPASRALLVAWRRNPVNPDRATGGAGAQMKAAIVDAFKGDDKIILLATESGAEGLNLQFCSLVVNFDLPWNPQRIEQRIGRCHRLKQQSDVTVVNFLNQNNRAEARAYELLTKKFGVFQETFDSSDAVMGSLEPGAVFERRVLEMIHVCRTNEEIDQAAKAIEVRQVETAAAAGSRSARTALDVFDETVAERLKLGRVRQRQVQADIKRRRVIIAECAKSNSRWDEMAGAMGQEPVSLTFHPEASTYAGSPGDIGKFAGQTGWLRVSKAHAPGPTGEVEWLLCAGVCDDGLALPPNFADQLFWIPTEAAVEISGVELPHAVTMEEQTRLAGLADDLEHTFEAWLEQQARDADYEKGNVQAELNAQEQRLQRSIKDINKAAKSLERTDQSTLVGMKAEVDKLQAKIIRLRSKKEKVIKKIQRHLGKMQKEAFARQSSGIEVAPIITMRWSIAGVRKEKQRG